MWRSPTAGSWPPLANFYFHFLDYLFDFSCDVDFDALFIGQIEQSEAFY